jgi:hypothetical protein
MPPRALELPFQCAQVKQQIRQHMSWSHVENRVGSGMASVNTEVAIFRKGLPENVTCEQSPEKGKKKKSKPNHLHILEKKEQQVLRS